jgi:hypothetical protein
MTDFLPKLNLIKCKLVPDQRLIYVEVITYAWTVGPYDLASGKPVQWSISR